jgi:hypothetical protein
METTPILNLSRETEKIHKNVLIAGVQARIQTDTPHIKSELLPPTLCPLYFIMLMTLVFFEVPYYIILPSSSYFPSFGTNTACSPRHQSV